MIFYGNGETNRPGFWYTRSIPGNCSEKQSWVLITIKRRWSHISRSTIFTIYGAKEGGYKVQFYQIMF